MIFFFVHTNVCVFLYPLILLAAGCWLPSASCWLDEQKYLKPIRLLFNYLGILYAEYLFFIVHRR